MTVSYDLKSLVAVMAAVIACLLFDELVLSCFIFSSAYMCLVMFCLVQI